LTWKSGLKVPFLPLGPSGPLQTILLSDLVGCEYDSPLQICSNGSLAHFFCIRSAPNIIVSSGLSHPTQDFQFKKVRQKAVTISSCLSHPTRSLSRIVCRGQEGPKVSKGKLMPDF
jgi:hypothetical protein